MLKSRKNNDYSFDFKVSIVESYLLVEASCRELALENDINNTALVNKWVIDYRAAGPDALRPSKKTLDKAKIDNESQNSKRISHIRRFQQIVQSLSITKLIIKVI